jgi:hypothetical protein
MHLGVGVQRLYSDLALAVQVIGHLMLHVKAYYTPKNPRSEGVEGRRKSWI